MISKKRYFELFNLCGLLWEEGQCTVVIAWGHNPSLWFSQGPRFKGILSEHGMAVSHSQLASQPTVPGPRFDGRSRFGPSISMA